MEKNEIKKILYKTNPKAFLSKIRMGIAYYDTFMDERGELVVSFEVPVNDMGEADFLPEMPAKYLIRWIV